MGKPGDKNQSKISNIYGRIPGAQDISKDRYTDPAVPGMGSPYNQTSHWDTHTPITHKIVGKVKDLATKAYEAVDTQEERSELVEKGKKWVGDKWNKFTQSIGVDSDKFGTGGPKKKPTA